MLLKADRKGSQVKVFLQGEIDHCSALEMKNEIEAAIQDCQIKTLLLDFTDVSFMDSSGVGMLIGRYRTMQERGGKIRAVGLTQQTEKLFRLAGLHRIIYADEQHREEIE